MTISTTPVIEGRRVNRYLGIVAGEAIMGADFVSDLFASVRDIVGGRAGAYEKELRSARQIALNDMMEEALGLGANAVVGVDLDFEVLRGSMLMCVASGTAVVLEDTDGRAPS